MTRRLTTRLGQILLDAEMVSMTQLETALRRQKKTGEMLGEILVDEGYLDEDTLLLVLERQYGVPSVRLDDFAPDPGLAKLIPYEIAWSSRIVPLALHDDAIDLAMVDPTDFVAMAHVRFAAGVRPNVFITTVAAAQRALCKLYDTDSLANETSVEPREAIKRMILERDATLLASDQDPREFYQLAANIETFVDEILRKAQSND